MSSDTDSVPQEGTLDGGQDPQLREAAIEAAGTGVHPDETTRVCPTCLVANSTSDAFCTACGTRLTAIEGANSPDQSDEDTAVASPGHSPSARHAPDTLAAAAIPPTSNPSAIRSRRVRAAIATVAVVGIAASAALAILWRSEAQHATRLGARLDATTVQLRATQSELAATQTKLTATSSLSARRRLVLLRAQTVLTKVDPLLSDADGLKQITVQIQTARDAFAADSAQMTGDLLTLENYEANPQNYPGIDQFTLVNQVNAELDLVRSDYATLTSSDGSFSTASTTFGNHADAFTTAVRGLQKQLKGVAGQ